MNWKYVKPTNINKVTEIENTVGVTFPTDYKKALPNINSGKPSSSSFDCSNTKGCVIDYMIDVDQLKDYRDRYQKHSLFPIATDPFGNIIGYEIAGNQLSRIIMWDHETHETQFVANNFSDFINMLYELD